jgi:hypothetical protein
MHSSAKTIMNAERGRRSLAEVEHIGARTVWFLVMVRPPLT